MIDNLYLSDQLLELKNKLEKWFENKDWFKDRDIQWKRGILLHGKPGTGKTSIITALAQHFKIPCFVFDLSNMTNDYLIEQWTNICYDTPCFVVFEDFDAIFNGRENIYNKNLTNERPVTFDCILNLLDGAKKYDGIVTFITTNNVDKIDPALGGQNNTRPGRIDYIYHTNDILDDNGKLFIAQKIFKNMPRENDLIKIAQEQSIDQTPAQFKELCISMALKEIA